MLNCLFYRIFWQVNHSDQQFLNNLKLGAIMMQSESFIYVNHNVTIVSLHSYILVLLTSNY